MVELFKFKSKLIARFAKIVAALGVIDFIWDLLGKIVTTFFPPLAGSQTGMSTIISTTTTTNYVMITTAVTTSVHGPDYTTLLPFTGTATSVSLNGAGLIFTPLPYGSAMIIVAICALVWAITK